MLHAHMYLMTKSFNATVICNALLYDVGPTSYKRDITNNGNIENLEPVYGHQRWSVATTARAHLRSNLNNLIKKKGRMELQKISSIITYVGVDLVFWKCMQVVSDMDEDHTRMGNLLVFLHALRVRFLQRITQEVFPVGHLQSSGFPRRHHPPILRRLQR